MAFQFAFGSIGDLLAVGDKAYTLAMALSKSRGSTKEYQDLIVQLRLFDQTILQVTLLVQLYETSPELEALCAVAEGVVNACQDVLYKFRDKVERKYGSTLGVSGDGGFSKTTGKKVVFLTERTEVNELRASLQSSTGTLSVLISTAIAFVYSSLFVLFLFSLYHRADTIVTQKIE